MLRTEGPEGHNHALRRILSSISMYTECVTSHQWTPITTRDSSCHLCEARLCGYIATHHMSALSTSMPFAQRGCQSVRVSTSFSMERSCSRGGGAVYRGTPTG